MINKRSANSDKIKQTLIEKEVKSKVYIYKLDYLSLTQKGDKTDDTKFETDNTSTDRIKLKFESNDVILNEDGIKVSNMLYLRYELSRNINRF